MSIEEQASCICEAIMIPNVSIVLVVCPALAVTAQGPEPGVAEPLNFSAGRGLGDRCPMPYGPVRISHLPKVMHLVHGRINSETQGF